jgi:hypothetical protein
MKGRDFSKLINWYSTMQVHSDTLVTLMDSHSSDTKSIL